MTKSFKFYSALYVFGLAGLIAGCTSTVKVTAPAKEPPKSETPKPAVIKEPEKVEMLQSTENWYYEYKNGQKPASGRKVSLQNYSDNNLLSETVVYDEDGSVLQRYVYIYNEKGGLIQTLRYNAQKTVDRKYVYILDENNKKIKTTESDSRGKVIRTYQHKYDENGNLVEDVWLNAKGKKEQSLNYKYNENGKKTEASRLNADGKLYYRYSYKYDNKDNMTEETQYNAKDIIISVTKYVNKYVKR